jgi:glycine dehydrogenase subunit 2
MSFIKENYGTEVEEKLVFEKGSSNADIAPPPDEDLSSLAGLVRDVPALPQGLSETEMMRHYVRLSQKNYSIDNGIFPLGSCTMKHNPRLNERVARLAGLADIHPLQPLSSVEGAAELMGQLGDWLKKLTGMEAVALSPRAGAHGELCGMMAIRKALQVRGAWESRKRVLVPRSAHGTNPATAALAGYVIDDVPADDKGLVRVSEIKKRLGDDLAGIMLTNPNTCGIFEEEIIEIAEAIHSAGGYFYCDGANFNAIAGKVLVGDLGVDAMHINLHKTFSTPHGGGGPGSGPVVFSKRLANYAPLPLVIDGKVIEHEADAKALGLDPSGRLTAFFGQMGMFSRALAYMISQGADGIVQASEDAVLNANYILASLKDLFSLPYDALCMHEVLLDDSFLKGTGIEVIDFAKAMIDEGVHPMTIYFPLVVSGAMLIEPTESESKESLDQFITMMRGLAQKALSGDREHFKSAPRRAPRGRFDETAAARNPQLGWNKNNP